jgi:hypothetical protein
MHNDDEDNGGAAKEGKTIVAFINIFRLQSNPHSS